MGAADTEQYISKNVTVTFCLVYNHKDLHNFWTFWASFQPTTNLLLYCVKGWFSYLWGYSLLYSFVGLVKGLIN